MMKGNNIKNPYLIRIMNGENELKVVEEAVKVYLNSSSWYEAGKKAGVNHQTMRTFIRRNEHKLNKKNPKLFNLYCMKVGRRRLIEYEDIEGIGETKEFTIDVLKALPKKISYNDFLNLVCTYKTGTMTSEELVNMANQVGVEVIG